MKNKRDAVDKIVAQWQRELPELEAEYMALIGRLTRCSLLLTAYLEQEFIKHGLTAWQFDVLATLRRSGEPYCLSPTELFSSMMVSSGTMTARLQKLEIQGWITREANPEDARSTLVRLTDEGKNLIEKSVFPHVLNEKTLITQLSPEVRSHLEEGLASLLAILEQNGAARG